MVEGFLAELKISLKFNKATVHEPTDWWLRHKQYRWLSFATTDLNDLRRPESGDEEKTLVSDVEVRISPYPVARHITVSYMNWQEMISELGATW